MVCFQTKNPHLGKKFLGFRLENVDIFYGYLGYFVTIRYILRSSGTFFPVLVSCSQKNLATLEHTYRKKTDFIEEGKNNAAASIMRRFARQQ
jgi:hypothetical protein